MVQFAPMLPRLLTPCLVLFGASLTAVHCSPPAPQGPDLPPDGTELAQTEEAPAPPPPCPQADDLPEARSPRSDAARIEAAWCLLRNAESARSLRVLEPVLASDPASDLADYAALVAAEAHLRKDEHTAAAALLSDLEFPEGPA
ncbi:MAG: hypothetical protein VX498_09185, partial [Myxococcota bacterium]|nr:hypothetical protein [Myxococcota bacterium]